MINVAVFASGKGTNFECIVTSQEAYVKVVLLVVDKEDAYAIQRALKLDIPYIYVNPKAYATKREYEEYIMLQLHKYHVEVIALAGYMRFIGTTLLSNYSKRIINLHPSYLPEFPGATSIKDAYESKANYSGVTVHYVDEGIDTGAIIYQERLEIQPKWDLSKLEEEIHRLEYRLFPIILNKICEEVEDEKSAN